MLCDFCVIFRAVLDFLKRVANFDAMYQCLKKMQFHVAHAGLGAVKFCFFRQANGRHFSSFMAVEGRFARGTSLIGDEQGETSAFRRLAGLNSFPLAS